MVAYVISQITITDPDAFKEYASRAPATVEKYGGKFIARGGKIVTLEGEEHTKRTVMMEFDSVETAEKWNKSPEYQEAKSFRENAADFSQIIVEGL